MKILEINKYFFVKGGAEKHFFDVLDLLKEKGNETAVFSMCHGKNRQSGWNRYFVSEVGYTREYPLSKKIKGALRMFHSFEARRKINKILDEFSPDIVHIHNIYHQLSPMILFEIKKRGIPVVMTVHDYKLVNPNYNLFHDGKFYDRCRDRNFYQCFLDKCIKDSYIKSFIAMLEMYFHEFLGTYKKNIDAYVVPSGFVRNILVERGIDGKKIKIIPHFVKESEGEVFDNGISEKYALFFGRIAKGKGVEDLADVFKDRSDMKIYLAGNIESDFILKNNNDNIKHLGFLGKDLLKKYIRNARFVVSPSKLPETFGLVALESISEGVPFIGYDSGAYSEIIRNGENGHLVKDKEELRKMVQKLSRSDDFDREKIKKEALAKYDAEVYYDKLMEVFKSLA
ncbi:MAG: glycosyltransferase [Candidatus Moranbacteria bacterium]|jgi:glycosyltransferase involved in cell wall biosynthesis|nr:glycosyltransferase [Candidatus Moranbacteria bacterium]MDX9855693.1 glycosyltransferase [Candidatus Moranbacteria bacterium]